MINPVDIYKARILIVDDLEANVLLLEQMLKGAGYTAVSSTMEPDRVCELHLLNQYDLILLDLLMPGMDGFAVMENLQTIETGGYLPVLVITAQSDHKLRALKAGARDFISKPFDLAEVLLRVYNMLEVRLLHLEAKALVGRVLAEKKVSERLLHELLPQVVAAPQERSQDASLLSGNRAELALLFLDVASFTAFAEGADAATLTGVLDEIANHEEGAPAYDRDRTLGEAYLASVGLPSPLADHTVASTEKALDLAESVCRFNSHNPYRLSARLILGTEATAEKRDARHAL